MLLELCVTELEDVASDRDTGRIIVQPIVQESPHPYIDDTSINGPVKIPGKLHLSSIRFNCSIERGWQNYIFSV